ncbi:hypothetical protein PC118_g15733 [Phytophthora cactorum]|uniref:Uncharacterized protein n=1 Tax=Phytophthora cactorum TaxID=29920 RepID=A0A8T1FGH5_9STRA|nr:hypothetical protein PC118_g15733 [Phytophthora cactorum]
MLEGRHEQDRVGNDFIFVGGKEKKLKQQIHYFGIENEFGCVNKRGVVVTCCLLLTQFQFLIRRTHCQETTITTSQTESRVSQAD